MIQPSKEFNFSKFLLLWSERDSLYKSENFTRGLGDIAQQQLIDYISVQGLIFKYILLLLDFGKTMHRKRLT